MHLTTGESAPWFTAATPSNPEFAFDTVAGRYVVLLFLPVEPALRATALKAVAARQAMFDDMGFTLFVVVRDPQTAAGAKDIRGLRWILDEDRAVSRLYGAVDEQGRDGAFWLALDPTLRLLKAATVDAAAPFFAWLASLPPPGGHAEVPLHAPVLIAPRVLEPELCRALIELHAGGGAAFSGVMRDQGDRTVAVMDELKQRRDFTIEDEALKRALRERMERRLYPLITRGLGFTATHMERYLVAAYDAAEGGVFHPHRDNLTFGTAHRKFACSINLNDDFEGGDLRFAEYGPRTYRPPAGGAVVFSSSLLHEATRVTAGRRYAFLTFFFDEDGAAVLRAYNERLAAEPAA
jgi:predicted 2-oxoglutarate/Fe(II)-dependent dioxygenase YbiX/peroxiredoxin